MRLAEQDRRDRLGRLVEEDLQEHPDQPQWLDHSQRVFRKLQEPQP